MARPASRALALVIFSTRLFSGRKRPKTSPNNTNAKQGTRLDEIVPSGKWEAKEGV